MHIMILIRPFKSTNLCIIVCVFPSETSCACEVRLYEKLLWPCDQEDDVVFLLDDRDHDSDEEESRSSDASQGSKNGLESLCEDSTTH